MMIAAIAMKSLDEKLNAIQKECALISHTDSPTGEMIHDLRVDCRRGIAALDFFRTVLPKNRCDRLRNRLKKVLRESSKGRDMDVMIHEWNDAHLIVPAPLLRKIKKRRAKNFHSVHKTVSKLHLDQDRKKLEEKLSERTALALSNTREELYAVWAKPRLTSIFDRLHSESLVDEWTPKNLHRFRLRIKKFRYTLELASSIDHDVAISIDSPLLAQIQRMLGEINDITVRLRHLRKYGNRMNDPASQSFLAQQLADDERELNKRISDWRQFWTPECQEKVYGALATRTF